MKKVSIDESKNEIYIIERTDQKSVKSLKKKRQALYRLIYAEKHHDFNEIKGLYDFFTYTFWTTCRHKIEIQYYQNRYGVYTLFIENNIELPYEKMYYFNNMKKLNETINIYLRDICFRNNIF
jgi:hypothetical protein